ncbi:MAG: penicillin acylase family protein, partial [Armatimonadetes bacterium]|nr:penicillin acylase family protein [Armatimonadota bacterium]
LFRLETDPSSPDRYRWDVRSAGVLPEDGQWRTMETRKETIRVKGGDPVEIAVRTTHLGPIVNDFAFRAPGDPDVALRRVPLCDEGVETIQGALAMMRATNVEEFAAGCGGWRFPSANCVGGDSRGRIGYRAVGAIPIRPRSAPDRNGGQGISATGNADAWQGFVPADLMPGVTDPDAGVILSANHRPVASFYSIPIGAGTGAMGETIRSWRLRELLAGDAKLTPEDVLKVHYDTVNPARREIVRLGLHLRDHGGGLSDAALRALQALEPWFRAGASSDLRSPGAALATRISTFFRIMATPLARRYGGGESGLARFLKDAARRIGADPAAAFDAEEREFVDQALSEAMQGAQGRPGAARPAVQDARSRRADRGAGASPAAGSSLRLGWFESLDGFGSLDAEGDLAGPAITCLDGQTIHCQSSQSYTQWVSLADPDSARVICPVGHSDRIESPYRASTAELWGKAELHAAPLSREAVQKVAHSHRVLSR